MSGGVGGGSREVSPYPDWAKHHEIAQRLAMCRAARASHYHAYANIFPFDHHADENSSLEARSALSRAFVAVVPALSRDP